MSGGSIIQIFREVRAGKQLARARNQKLKQDEIRTWKRLYFELIYSKETPEEVKFVYFEKDLELILTVLGKWIQLCILQMIPINETLQNINFS